MTMFAFGRPSFGVGELTHGKGVLLVWRLVGTRAGIGQQGESAGSSTGVTYKTKSIIAADVKKLRVRYANWRLNNGEVNGSAAINVGASLDNGSLSQVLFSGVAAGAIAAGAQVESDDIAADIAAGTAVYFRSYPNVPTLGQKWPLSIATITASGEGNSPGDLTLSGTVSTAFAFAFGPAAIIGLVPRSTKAYVIIGDSIAYGQGDSALNAGHYSGLFVRAINDTAGWAMLAKPGAQLSDITTSTKRLALIDGLVTDVLCNCGTNDFSGGAALATIQSRAITVWTAWALQGRVHHTTCVPKTTSSDAWVTTANQTVTANESVRLAWNAWLRDGAPMSGGVAVAVGTADAIRVGQAGHPLYRIHDVAAAVEATGGVWIASRTADGIHPNSTAAAAMATAINLD